MNSNRLAALGLLLAAVVALSLEQAGLLKTPSIRLSGDVQREAKFLAQYGQTMSVLIASALVYLHHRSWRSAVRVAGAVIVAMLLASSIKVIAGRVRPAYDGGGTFHGPAAFGLSSHMSFPSAHTACAFALSAALVAILPRGRAVFWVLAATCGLLRWIDAAHWPADILAGAAVGLLAYEAVELAFPRAAHAASPLLTRRSFLS